MVAAEVTAVVSWTAVSSEYTCGESGAGKPQLLQKALPSSTGRPQFEQNTDPSSLADVHAPSVRPVEQA